MAEWHLMTGEFPPQPGGVADYTYLLASHLEKEGHSVHVWCPNSGEEPVRLPGVVVHPELGHLSPTCLRRVSKLLDRFPQPRRLLVQWVPQAFGYRSMNVPFCLWLWNRVRTRRDRLDLMVHEAFSPFSKTSMKRSVMALAHRAMSMILLQAARNVWVATPRWESCLRPYALGRSTYFRWLPVPSNIPVHPDPLGPRIIRQQYARSREELLLGHFGSGNALVTSHLEAALTALMNTKAAFSFLLVGRATHLLRQRFLTLHPGWADWLHATGELAPEETSLHLAACDLFLQPYPDGVSTRRTSLMAALAHGVPVVTTVGPATESLWSQSQAVALAPTNHPVALAHLAKELMHHEPRRLRLARKARSLYQSRFDIQYTVQALNQSA